MEIVGANSLACCSCLEGFFEIAPREETADGLVSCCSNCNRCEPLLLEDLRGVMWYVGAKSYCALAGQLCLEEDWVSHKGGTWVVACMHR